MGLVRHRIIRLQHQIALQQVLRILDQRRGIQDQGRNRIHREVNRPLLHDANRIGSQHGQQFAYVQPATGLRRDMRHHHPLHPDCSIRGRHIHQVGELNQRVAGRR